MLLYCIFGIYIKFTTFLGKNEHHSLSISEIIDSGRRGYLKYIKCPVSENRSGVNVLINYLKLIKELIQKHFLTGVLQNSYFKIVLYSTGKHQGRTLHKFIFLINATK